jgi:RHS repeat-associated protein
MWHEDGSQGKIHGFTGHPHDDDLGLIDMGGRVYSPSTRQFITPDPLGRLGASPYSYVRNNPLTWIDPSGFTEEEPEGHWYSGLTNLFSSAPVAAVDMSGSLGSQVAAALRQTKRSTPLSGRVPTSRVACGSLGSRWRLAHEARFRECRRRAGPGITRLSQG